MEPKALKTMMRVENLKELLRTYRENPNIRDDDALFFHFLTRVQYFMNRAKRKDRLGEDQETKVLLLQLLNDLGSMGNQNHVKTVAAGLGVLSKMYSTLGFAGPELKTAQTTLCAHTDQRLKKGDFDEDLKTLILVLSSFSRMNFSTKSYITRLAALIDKVEFEMLGNLIDAEHLLIYFDAVSVRLEEHPIFNASMLSNQLKTADTSMKLALCLNAKLDTLSTFQLIKVFEIIATSRLEAVSNRGFVSSGSC